METQTILPINVSDLAPKVKEFFDAGYRLVQIGATKTDVFELNYSFDKAYEFVNLKVTLSSLITTVPSISSIYWNAFLYENEIHDLFGIQIDGIAVDYKGKFYRMAAKTPFGEQKND